MAYLRNPRMPYCWESDGAAPWCKYKADDGTIHDSAKEADEHDLERGFGPWDEALATQQTRLMIQQIRKKPEVRQSRPVWRWLKDRWLWMRFFSWQ